MSIAQHETDLIIRGLTVIGKHGQYEVKDKCIKVNGKYFKTEEEIERYRYFILTQCRAFYEKNNMDFVLNEAVQVIRLRKHIVKNNKIRA